MSFVNDLKVAFRSLARTKGLALTVVLTLALGIGANSAIFTLVRGVLLKPLVNRDEDRLIYVRQSAPGVGDDNTNFSVPEIQDLRAGVKTLSAFGDFSTVGFTMIDLGQPREVQAGVVGGNYFDVMGLHPVLGRWSRRSRGSFATCPSTSPLSMLPLSNGFRQFRAATTWHVQVSQQKINWAAKSRSDLKGCLAVHDGKDEVASAFEEETN
jgi:MacB-like periplasmic core domain